MDISETQKGSKMNAKVAATVKDGLRVEHVGDEIVLLDSAGLVAHTLSGDVARCFELVASGQIETEVSPALETLAAAGLVTITDGTDETAVSRRKALAFGAVGAGVVAVGLSSMALPVAAATASSGSTTTTSSSTTTTIPAGQPTNDGIIGTSKSGLSPVRYFVNANWSDDNSPFTEWAYTYEVTVGSTSPVLTPGDTLASGSGTGSVLKQITQWGANPTLTVTMTLTSDVGAVIYSEANLTRP